MNYPINLIKAYKRREISRAEFCHEWAKLQGFDDTVKGHGNIHGTFITYRGRTAKITNCLLVWSETHKIHNKKQIYAHTAKSIREMKTKIDIYAQGEKWT